MTQDEARRCIRELYKEMHRRDIDHRLMYSEEEILQMKKVVSRLWPLSGGFGKKKKKDKKIWTNDKRKRRSGKGKNKTIKGKGSKV